MYQHAFSSTLTKTDGELMVVMRYYKYQPSGTAPLCLLSTTGFVQCDYPYIYNYYKALHMYMCLNSMLHLCNPQSISMCIYHGKTLEYTYMYVFTNPVCVHIILDMYVCIHQSCVCVCVYMSW